MTDVELFLKRNKAARIALKGDRENYLWKVDWNTGQSSYNALQKPAFTIAPFWNARGNSPDGVMTDGVLLRMICTATLAAAIAQVAACQRSELHEQTLYTLRATHAGLVFYKGASGKLPTQLRGVCDREPSWCTSDDPDRWFRDGWSTPIRYSPRDSEYVLTSAGPDRRFETKDDIIFDSAIDWQRATALSGCYVLSQTLSRLGTDTLRFSTHIAKLAGYAIDWPLLVDSTEAFYAVWHPGPSDSIYAAWIHVHNGLSLSGTVVDGKLTASTGTQRVTGRKQKC